MNAVWNSYGQLCGCPEIFKKSCKFFCRELDIRVSEIMETDGRKTSLFQSCMKLMMQNATGKRLSRIPAANKVQWVIAATNFGA